MITNPDGACAVDPVDLDDMDPDAITRRTGEKGGEPTGQPETDLRANERKQKLLQAQNEAAASWAGL